MTRKLSFAVAVVLVFAVSVLILLRLFPGPHQPGDYLVVGTLATFLCILLVFVLVISTSNKGPNVFYKRRR